jgi:perosamine synthetase
VVLVHFAGRLGPVEEIAALCKKRGVALIEDCAHACPSFYKNGNKNLKAGQEADIACYSFYATKTISAGEGGMAATNNENYADRMRIMSLHGISKDAWKRFTAKGSWKYEIAAPGFKYNMTDIAASLGIHQLKKADYFREERAKIAKKYHSLLKDIEGLILPREKKNTISSWHLFAVRIQSGITKIHRDEVIEKLKENGIGASVHYMPLHLHPYYREKYGYKAGDFPVSEKLFSECLSLPIYPGLSDSQIEKIANTLIKTIKRKKS